MRKVPNTLHVLLFTEYEYWIMQCIDIDISAQGKTFEDVRNSFNVTLAGNLCLALEKGFEPFFNLKEAPEDLIRKYDCGEPFKNKWKIDLLDMIKPKPECDYKLPKYIQVSFAG